MSDTTCLVHETSTSLASLSDTLKFKGFPVPSKVAFTFLVGSVPTTVVDLSCAFLRKGHSGSGVREYMHTNNCAHMAHSAVAFSFTSAAFFMFSILFSHIMSGIGRKTHSFHFLHVSHVSKHPSSFVHNRKFSVHHTKMKHAAHHDQQEIKKEILW